MKHFAIAMILLAVGLLVVSPFEEILILIPLATYYDMPELMVLFNVIGVACLIGAVYFLGKSSVTGPFHRHWKSAVVGLIIVAIYAYWWWTG